MTHALEGSSSGKALGQSALKSALRLIGGADLADAIADLTGLSRVTITQLARQAVDQLMEVSLTEFREIEPTWQGPEAVLVEAFKRQAMNKVPVAALQGAATLLEVVVDQQVQAEVGTWSDAERAYFFAVASKVADLTCLWYRDDPNARALASAAGIGQVLRDHREQNAALERIEGYLAQWGVEATITTHVSSPKRDDSDAVAPARAVLKHYVYISPPKVERLYNQLPSLTDDIHIEPTLQEKLRVVLDALDNQMGSLEFPARVFRGELLMKHGIFPVHPAAEPTVAMWLGVIDAGSTLIALGGSANYVDAAIPRGKVNNSGEGTLFEALASASGRRVNMFESDRRGLGVMASPSLHHLSAAWDSDAADVWAASESTMVRMEFAAYWLSERREDVGHGISRVIVGSPLYVSYGSLES
jgi:hypothetical protein